MNVLLAIDHSSCSDAAVTAVGERFRPERTVVRVLHVIDWPRDLPPEMAFGEGPEAAHCVLRVHDQLRRAGEELVADAATRLRAAGFETTSAVVEGDPRGCILEMAGAWHADTIVVGSHGRRGFDRLLLGSVSEGVVRHAPCSVSVIREHTSAAA